MTQRARFILAGVSVALTLVACGGDSVGPLAPRETLDKFGRDTTALLQTDLLEYVLQPVAAGYSATIRIALRNPEKFSIAVSNCRESIPPMIIRNVGVTVTDWTPYEWMPVAPPCEEPATIVPPGETGHLTLTIICPGDAAGLARCFTLGIPAGGNYALRWSAIREFAVGRTGLVLSGYYSNMFTLRVAR